MATLKIDRKSLLEGLEAVVNAISTRATHPVLGMFFLSCQEGTLTIRGFDLTLGIEYRLPIGGQESLSFTLPRLVVDLISQLSSEFIELEIETEENGFIHTLKTDKTQTKIHGLCAEDYPDFPTIPSDIDPVTFPTDVFVSACKRLSHAASTEATKQILCGINIKSDGNKLKLAATDGHRLAWIVEDAEIDFCSQTFNVSGLSEIAKIAKQTLEETILLSFFDDSLFAQIGNNCSIYSRMLTGGYPEYENLIPQKFEETVTLQRSEFLSALRYVDTLKTIQVSLNITSYEMEIEGIAIDKGTIRIQIDCLADVKTERLLLNTKYLMDGVRFLEGDEITLKFNGAIRPVVLFSSTHPNSQYLLMPILQKA
jgi:DNA polymerase-3 subunit beta